MRPTEQLHHDGQSLWLDNITRDLLESGTLQRYIDELGITGLTSNPTIFANAFATGGYDDRIAAAAARGLGEEEIFFELAIADLRVAADLFGPVFEHTHGLDGWVSLEVSPSIAYDTEQTIEGAIALHRQAGRPNLFIKIPATREGLTAVEEAIFAGVPVNVTLLFSREHYLAAADAYMRGIERRLDAGLDPAVGSVASVFVSRWDSAEESIRQPLELRNRLGIAMAKRTYQAYRGVLGSDRWARLANAGARPQRLLWASTGTKDPNASDVLYVRELATPFTVNTMPESTLLAFGDHGTVERFLPHDGGDAEHVLWRYALAGIDVDGLADRLRTEGADAFVRSWEELIGKIAAKTGRMPAAA